MDAVVGRLGLPLVVKPPRRLRARCHPRDEPRRLPKAMVDCFAYGDAALSRRRRGTEVAVSVVEPATARHAAGRRDRHRGHYDYDARYNPGRTEFFAPARLPDDVGAVVGAPRRAPGPGAAGLSRSDLILDADGAHFLEVNVAPGMTETSLLPQATEAAGRRSATLPGDWSSVASPADRRKVHLAVFRGAAGRWRLCLEQARVFGCDAVQDAVEVLDRARTRRQPPRGLPEAILTRVSNRSDSRAASSSSAAFRGPRAARSAGRSARRRHRARRSPRSRGPTGPRRRSAGRAAPSPRVAQAEQRAGVPGGQHPGRDAR